MALDGDVWLILIPGEGEPVEGLVLELTEAGLAAADLYEGDAYRRIRVRLTSGLEGWVYVASLSEQP